MPLPLPVRVEVRPTISLSLTLAMGVISRSVPSSNPRSDNASPPFQAHAGSGGLVLPPCPKLLELG